MEIWFILKSLFLQVTAVCMEYDVLDICLLHFDRCCRINPAQVLLVHLPLPCTLFSVQGFFKLPDVCQASK